VQIAQRLGAGIRLRQPSRESGGGRLRVVAFQGQAALVFGLGIVEAAAAV
jgi:hypothetical protein